MVHQIPLFIGGTGRSGTTIVTKMIAAHPKVCTTPESRFQVDPDGVYDVIRSSFSGSLYIDNTKIKRLFTLLDKVVNESKLESTYSKVELKYLSSLPIKLGTSYASSNLLSFSPNLPKLVGKLKEDLIDFEFDMTWVGQERFGKKKMFCPVENEQFITAIRNFLSDFTADTCKHQNAAFLLDSNTWNILFLDELIKIHSDFKIVNVYRDPFQVVNSFLSQSWMPSDVEQSSEILVRLSNQIKKNNERFGDKILNVKFENFADNPELEMQRIYRFYNLDYNDKWLEIPFNSKYVSRPISDKVLDKLKANKKLVELRTSLGYE